MLKHKVKAFSIRNDAVIVCAGGLRPTQFLRDLGILVEPRHGAARDLRGPPRALHCIARPKNIGDFSVSLSHLPIREGRCQMASTLSIAYSVNHDLLGVVSEEEYQQFKNQLLLAFQEEWPDATITVDDDEEVYAEIEGISGQAELDVRVRIADIVNEVLDSGEWLEHEEDFNDEDDAEDIRDVEEKDDY